jgi:hypothetical protein
MTKNLTSILASLLFLFGTIIVLNVGVAQAQPAATATQTLPTLTDVDFQNLIELYPVMVKDPGSYVSAITAKGLDPVTFQGAATKILSNVTAVNAPAALDALKAQYGDSILLTDAEKTIFDKYKDKLVELVATTVPQQ